MKQTIELKQLHSFLELNHIDKTFHSSRFEQLQELLRKSKDSILNEHDFSIGALMELLTKHCQYINPMFYPKNWKGWCVDVVFQDGSRMQEEFPELIDGLWKALTQMVNKMEM